jgi:hypothetical protein
MRWVPIYWWKVLLSPFKGLLTWMPIFFLALAGLLIQMKKHHRLLLPLLIVLVLDTLVNASSSDWFGGGGYGPRRYTSELTILILGYAGLLQWLPRKVRFVGGGLVAAVLALHQWILLRYGLPEAMGGRVLSMLPDIRWEESDYGTLIRQLAAHVPDMITRPIHNLHWPFSPLGTLYGGQLPLGHVAMLLITGLFVALCWLVVRRLTRAGTLLSSRAQWLLLLLLLLAVVGADIWLLTWA